MPSVRVVSLDRDPELDLTAAVQLQPRDGPGAGEDVRAVLARMKDASRKTGAPTHDERIASLEALERVVTARKGAVVDAIARDFGHRAKEETLLADVFAVLSAIKHTKAHLLDWMRAEDRETTWVFQPSTSRVLYQPVGVVGIISSWNYPVQLALIPLVTALAAGNRAILKPSEIAPRTAELLKAIAAEAFAADRVHVVLGGADVGAAFATLPFDHLVFTGSTRVGKLVMRAASENLVPVTLELGGKSPAIVGRDFGTGAAASRIMAGKTFNAGQTCVAPDYALVAAASRAEFVEGCRAAIAKMFPTIAGNPDYTAIVNDGHYARITAYLDDARGRRATVLNLAPAGETAEALGAARKIPPTLVLDPTGEMACMQDEIFGPVLPVVTYDDLNGAIAYVNERPRPLALYYFGHDQDDIDRVLAETISGGVAINETMIQVLQDDLPFGGVGASGMGHYHGREGFETLSKKKAVYQQARIHTAALLRPPYGVVADRVLRFLTGR